MPTILEEIFPFPKPSNMIRTPYVKTNVVVYESGQEQRNKIWPFPTFAFELGWDILDYTDVNSLAHFYIKYGGMWQGFLFQDPQFPQNSGEWVGWGDGTSTLFKIYGNRASSIQAYVNGSSVSATYSLSNGAITYTVAPTSGAALTCDVQSERFVVRFEDKTKQSGSIFPGLDHEIFMWSLARNMKVTLIQPAGWL